MNALQLFFELGLNHVLDFEGYDHILFLIVMVAAFSLHDWKQVLGLVTCFTIGHTVSLVLSSYEIVQFDSAIIEFLIPVTILITAAFNILKFTSSNNQKKSWLLYVTTLLFGLIHGFGFSTYFKMMASSQDKLVPLVGFALGIELAQIIIVCSVLILGFVALRILNVSLRDWVMVLSSIVVGVVLPILKDTWPF